MYFSTRRICPAPALLALLLCAAPSSALAQTDEVPSPPAASGASPTLGAFDPFELSDPAEASPRPARPAGVDERPVVDEVLVLPFAANELVLHYRRASDEPFRPVCTAPCRATLLGDRYQLAVAPPEHYPRIARREFSAIHPGDVLQLHHESRAGIRTVGWVLMSAAATALAGSAVTLNVLILVLIGVPIGGILALIALPMVAMMDHASVEIRPIPENLVRP